MSKFRHTETAQDEFILEQNNEIVFAPSTIERARICFNAYETLLIGLTMWTPFVRGASAAGSIKQSHRG